MLALSLVQSICSVVAPIAVTSFGLTIPQLLVGFPPNHGPHVRPINLIVRSCAPDIWLFVNLTYTQHTRGEIGPPYSY